MKWYLLKTWVGKEEDLVKEIRNRIPSSMYEECFVIYQERVWRKQQKSVIHVESLFPGCVFLTCQETEPLFRSLKRIPVVTKLMGTRDLEILPLRQEDVDFLVQISGKNHIVKLSYVVKDDQGQIYKISDPLKACLDQIERYLFKKRYVMVRHRLWGEDKAIVMGIILKEDAVEMRQHVDIK